MLIEIIHQDCEGEKLDSKYFSPEEIIRGDHLSWVEEAKANNRKSKNPGPFAEFKMSIHL